LKYTAAAFGVLVHLVHAPVVTNPSLLRVADEMIRQRGQQRHLSSEFSWQPLVIGVEQRNPLSTGRFYSQIARAADTLVLLVQVYRIRKLPGCHLPGFIFRTIIDHNDLSREKGLGCY